MNGKITPFTRFRAQGIAVLAGIVMSAGGVSFAQNMGAWNFNGDDSWGTTSRWLGSTIGGGAGSLVLFNNDIGANRTISLNGNRTVGILVIGDLSGTQQFTLAPGTPSNSTLTFDMGTGGNSFLNKFQGGVDTISAPILTNDQLNLRITTQTLNLSGALSGTGSLTKYYNGLLQLTGNNTGSTVGLRVANRGANNTTPEVELAAATGNAIGGDITIGNAGFAGGTGYAVLQLQQGRSNLNQIADTATLTFNGLNSKWGYFKLMGGSETVGGLIDSNNSAVIENREGETSVTTPATLTVAGSGDSFVGAYIRDNSGNNQQQSDSAGLPGGGAHALSLTKSGAGTLKLSGGNIIYTGNTTVSGGTLILSQTTNFRSNITNNAAVVFDVTSGTWTFQKTFADPDGTGPLTAPDSQKLTIQGSGSVSKSGAGILLVESSGNSMGALSVKNGTLTLNGTGNTISGGISLSGSSGLARILNLNGTSTISNGLTATGRYGVAGSGVFISNSNTITGAVNVTAAKMELSGASGVIGTPTSITLSGNPYVAGEFSIDNTSANANRVGNTTVFNSNGGIFRMNGGSETLGTLTLNKGELRFITSNSGAVTFNNSLVRNAGSTVSFATTTIGTGADKVTFTVAPGLANGLIGGWATVGNRFATYGGNGVTAAAVTTQNDINAWTSTQNIRVNGGSTTAMSANRAVNSLVIEDTTARTVNLGAATRVLTITSGGILSVSNNHVISNGKLTAGPSASGSGVVAPGLYELITQVNTNQLTINSVIDDNAGNAVSLTKAGNGLLILNGANTYTGKTYVNAGNLRITGADNRLGIAPGSFVADQLQINGGNIQIFGSTNTSANRGITIGTSGGQIQTGTNATTTEIVNINAPINGLGVVSFAVEGDAVNDVRNTLNLNAAANNFGAGFRTEGGFEGNLNVFGTNTIGGMQIEGGVVTLKGTNTISGDILLNSGSLVLEQANTFNGDSVTSNFGQLVFHNSNGLGSAPIALALGNGQLNLQNGVNVTLKDLTSNTGTNTAARIANGSSTPSTLTLDMPISRTFAGVITDGGTGSLSLVKRGPGTLTLSNFQNAFSGVVRVEEGTLDYTSANYSYVSSAMGAHPDYDPANLVINGGSVMFSLTTPATTDRSFTMGPGANGATIVANGATRADLIELGVKFDDPDFPYVSPDIAFEGTGSRTLTLAGFNQGNNLFNLRITDKSVSEKTSLLKVASGYWNVGRANTYTGLTTIMDGFLTPTVNEAFGAAGGLGTVLMGGRLDLQGVNYTTPEALFFDNGELFGSTGDSVWAGDWNFNVHSNVRINAGASITELGNLTGNRNMTVVGEGTLILKGSHSTSGATNFTGATVVQVGTLVLDYSVNQGSKLADGNILVLGGGRRGGVLVMTGGTHSANAGEEIVSGVRIDAGNNEIYRDPSSNTILRMNTITRNPGSTIYFDQPGIAKVDNPNVNGILGAWAIVRDTDVNGDLDWAKNSTGLGDGLVVAASSYTTNFWTANANTDVKSSALSIRAAVSTTNTLRFNLPTTPGDLEVQLQPFTTPANNQIQTGGILVTPKMGSNDAIISGPGTLYTGTAQQVPDFLINQYNTAGNLIISSRLIDNPNDLADTSGTLRSGDSTRVDISPGLATSLYVGMGVNLSINGTEVGGTLNASNLRRIDIDDSTFSTGMQIVITPTGGGTPFAATITGVDRTNHFITINVDHAGGGASADVGTRTLATTISAVDNTNNFFRVATAHPSIGQAATVDFVHSNGLEKLGPGVMILTGQNTYTGVTTIASGTVTTNLLADGGLPSGIGASPAAAGNLAFNGGTLRYLGETTSTNRGFTVNNTGRLDIGLERTEVTFSGSVSSADRIEKAGAGTLIMSGAATGVTEWLIDGGTVQMNMNAGNNRFATGLSNLVMAGGTLDVVGDKAANRLQQFGNYFIVNEGASQVRVTSVYDDVNAVARTNTIQLGGVDDIYPVTRNAGGTVLFVENPQPLAGSANINLFVPAIDQARILPYATYWDTSNISQAGVNNFAAVDITSDGVVSADFLSLHKIGSLFLDPNNWTEFINPSEGAAGAFNGSLTADRKVNTLRYFMPEDSTVTVPTGRRLSLGEGAIMIGSHVKQGVKQIVGGGSLSGGLVADDGGRDLIFHNYNTSTPFTVGVSIVDEVVNLTGGSSSFGGNTTVGSNYLTVGFGSSTVLFDLQPGMVVSGPGISPGTTIELVDIASGFNRVILSQSAISTNTNQSYTFTDRSNLIQTGWGTTILSGNNSYSGTTFVHGGVLRLDSANAVPGGIGSAGGTSHIAIEGGVIGLASDNFSRGLGTANDQVEFKGSGGFAAYGADRTVNFGGAGAAITFGRNSSFVPSGESFVFGATDATHKVTLVNPLDLNVLSQIVRADNGLAAIEGELGGVVSGNAELVKMGLGALRLSASNTYSGGTNLAEGTLIGGTASGVFGSGPVRVGTSTTRTNANARLDLVFEGGTYGNAVTIGNANSTGNTMVRFSGNGAMNGAMTLERNAFLGADAGVVGTVNGQISGSGNLILASPGSVALTNASNSFGSGASTGDAVDGGSIVRAGSLLVGATGVLPSGVVELGDALPASITVNRVTTGQSLALKQGSFNPDHNGEFPTGAGIGPGAFIEVSDTIDGRTFTAADEGVFILVKDEYEHPEWNGVYQVVFDNDGQAPGTMNLARVSSFDEGSEMLYGVRVSVAAGSEAGASYFLAGTSSTPNTSPVHFRKDVTNAGVALLATADGVTVSNGIDINSTNGSGTTSIGAVSTLTGGSVAFTGDVTLRNILVGTPENRSVQLTSSIVGGHGVEFSGLFSEADSGGGPSNDKLSLVKVGSGVATLTAANVYSGTTAINEGTLLVNNTTGSGTGTGAVTVNAGGTLGGVGTIQGPVTLIGTDLNKATLLPGDPLITTGTETLTLGSSLTLDANSIIEFGLASALDFTRLVTSSIAAVDPTAQFKVTLQNGYMPVAGDTFDLLDWVTGPSTGDLNWLDNLILPALTGVYWDVSQFNISGEIFATDQPVAPIITTSPKSQAANPGTDVTLFVVAVGSAPFEYQWQRGTTDIPGATSDTLVLSGVSNADEGSYRVIVTNSAGNSTSDPAVVTVNDPVTIVAHPQNQILADGQLATFSVTATGTNPIDYQWQRNLVDIPGATSSSYSVVASDTSTGSYRCVVSNVVGAAISDPAVLSLGIEAEVVQQPVAQMKHVGDTLILQVAAAGQLPIKYQWKKNGSNISGATGPTLTITGVKTSNAGAYKCVVSNVVNGVTFTDTSDEVQVGVVDPAVKTIVLNEPGKTTFSVVTAGNLLTYQWLKDNNPISGATAKSLSLSGLLFADSGQYVCQVTGPGGTINGGVNALKIYDQAPALSADPMPDAIVSGDYTYQIALLDPDHGAATSYGASGLPPGLKVNSTTGVISGRPTATKGAPYSVAITASNARGKSTLTLTLNVIALPTTVVGVFKAPVDRNAVLNGGLGGTVDVTTSSSGSYTGKLILGATSYSFKGVLIGNVADPDHPTALATITRKSASALTVSFGLDATTNQMTGGTVTDGAEVASFTGWRNVWSKTNPATALAGTSSAYYTLAFDIPASQVGNLTVPQGTGYASFTLAATTGKLTVSGKLSDGEAISYATFAGPDGEIVLFKTMYASASRGSIVGTLKIQTASPYTSNTIDHTLSEVSWWRPFNSSASATSTAGRTYKAGFGPLDLTAMGGVYVAPVSPDIVLGLNPSAPDNAHLVFTAADGGQIQPAPAPDVVLSIGASNKVTMPPSANNPRKTTLTLTASKGTITGTFTMVDANPLTPTQNVTRKVTYQGLIVGSKAYGYFLLPDLPQTSGETTSNTRILSGQVVLEAN